MVEVLVGDAFDRLDPLARRVMQALAVFGMPVPAVAVDDLLHPHDTRSIVHPCCAGWSTPASPTVTMAVTTCTPWTGPTPWTASPRATPFLRLLPSSVGSGSCSGAADYFASTRTPRHTWRVLDDVAAPLAEFDLRYQVWLSL